MSSFQESSVCQLPAFLQALPTVLPAQVVVKTQPPVHQYQLSLRDRVLGKAETTAGLHLQNCVLPLARGFIGLAKKNPKKQKTKNKNKTGLVKRIRVLAFFSLRRLFQSHQGWSLVV